MSAPGSCSPIWAPHIAYHDDGSLTESSFLNRTLVRHTSFICTHNEAEIPETKYRAPSPAVGQPCKLLDLGTAAARPTGGGKA